MTEPLSVPDLAAFREALTARLAPSDAVEEHWVGEIAFALWQQQRLQALAALALAAAEADTDEPDGTSRLPSLATLARYRARFERDLRLARQELEAARQSHLRPLAEGRPANPARLRWMADWIEEGAGGRAPANDAREPEPEARAEPEPPAPTFRPLNRRERRRLQAVGRVATTQPGLRSGRPRFALDPPRDVVDRLGDRARGGVVDHVAGAGDLAVGAAA